MALETASQFFKCRWSEMLACPEQAVVTAVLSITGIEPAVNGAKDHTEDTGVELCAQYMYCNQVKGTVARDFTAPVFFIKSVHLGP